MPNHEMTWKTRKWHESYFVSLPSYRLIYLGACLTTFLSFFSFFLFFFDSVVVAEGPFIVYMPIV